MESSLVTDSLHTLDRLLRKVLLADPAKGRVNLLKVDLADGYYHMHLGTHLAPKLAVVFPSSPGEPPWLLSPLAYQKKNTTYLKKLD